MSLAEDWRYTPIKHFPATGSVVPLVPEISSMPEGVTVAPLAWADFVRCFPPDHPGVMPEGRAWQITVAEGVAPETVIAITLAAQAGMTQTVGLALRLGRNSRLCLQKHLSGSGCVRVLTTLDLAENARLDYARLQTLDPDARALSLLQANLDRGAVYHHTALTLGGLITRQEDEICLNAPEADVQTRTISLLKHTQHGDVTTRIRHEAPHTVSSQLARTVLADESVGVFQGLIRVAPEAQKTDGKQMSRALLLSPTATMNAKPELEIFADDVKCSHGTAIGALDDNALFYLRARGVDEAAARRLLVHGFITETLEDTLPALRPFLEAPALDWLERLA